MVAEARARQAAGAVLGKNQRTLEAIPCSMSAVLGGGLKMASPGKSSALVFVAVHFPFLSVVNCLLTLSTVVGCTLLTSYLLLV